MASKFKSKKRKRLPPGTPPGILAPPDQSPPTIVRVMAYDTDRLHEQTITQIEDIVAIRSRYPVIWVDCDGLGNSTEIQKIADLFQLHPLAVEDAVNTDQRAKFEDFERSLFLVCHRPYLEEGELVSEQVSIFIGDGFVVSVQDRHEKDSFEPLRDRLRKSPGRRLRRSGADYLGYCILDFVIDSAFPVLENFGDILDDMEDRVLSGDRQLVPQIHRIKRGLHLVRRSMWPLRDALASIMSGHKLIQEETFVYLRDCFDHTLQIVDIVETYRERASGLMDLFLTSQNNRLNEIMKVLTIIATIFMPLSFVASLYGMNFDTTYPLNMPELHWPYGYVAVLAVMCACVAVMLVYFARKGWFR